MAMKIQFRRDTASSWTSNNPVLLEGELGLDTTDDRFKIGDGTTNWNTLAYSYGDWNTLINKPSTFTPSAGGSVGQVLTNVSNGVGTWQDAAGGVNLTSATTAPSSPTAGDQWFDTANGILYAYMTDGTQTQWLDISSANGQAAAAAGGGAMELISTTTITSSVASVEFTGLSGYNRFVLHLNRVGTNYAQPRMVFGTNGVYDTSSSYKGDNTTFIALGSNNYKYGHTCQVSITGLLSNATGNYEQTIVSGEGSSLSSSNVTYNQINASHNDSSGRNCIKIYTDSNNFIKGSFSLYGIKDS
jgi:hypothetical protein